MHRPYKRQLGTTIDQGWNTMFPSTLFYFCFWAVLFLCVWQLCLAWIGFSGSSFLCIYSSGSLLFLSPLEQVLFCPIPISPPHPLLISLLTDSLTLKPEVPFSPFRTPALLTRASSRTQLKSAVLSQCISPPALPQSKTRTRKTEEGEINTRMP